jgi:hypothetical protein
MKNHRAVWALSGFLAGLITGSGMCYLFLRLYNLACPLLRTSPIVITWGVVLPLGILIGLALALNMLNSSLGD